MRFKPNILVLLLVLFIVSCSPITKTQFKSINQYFQTLEPYPVLFRDAQKLTANIKLNRILLYPESYKVDSIMIESLVSSFEGYSQNTLIAGETELLVSELEEYIKEYFILLPNGFSVMNIIKSGSSVIGRYFGFGDIVRNVLSQEKLDIKMKKAGKIKDLVIKGDTLMKQAIPIINKYAVDVVKEDLKNEREYIRINYKKFLDELHETPDSYEYYAIYNKIFIRHFQMVYNSEIYSDKLIEVTNDIYNAHIKLKDLIEKRQKLKSGIPEIHELYNDITNLKNIRENLRMQEVTNSQIIQYMR